MEVTEGLIAEMDSDTSTELQEEMLKDMLNMPIKLKFSVKALSQCVILQLTKQDLQLMFTEFQDIFEILIESEVKMIKPILKEKLRAVRYQESLAHKKFSEIDMHMPNRHIDQEELDKIRDQLMNSPSFKKKALKEIDE